LDGISACFKAATYTQNNITQSKRTQASMPRVGLEPTAPVLPQGKIVYVLDRAVTVIGSYYVIDHYVLFTSSFSCPISLSN
jgi:hypothetical protein